jgi:hypothetical protein
VPTFSAGWSPGGAPSDSNPIILPALQGLRKAAQDQQTSERFKAYQTAPQDYAREVLGVSLWGGCNGQKGQLEIAMDMGESVRRQLAGDDSAPKIFRAPAGHGVGKTYFAACLVNWFFDSFTPSITLTTAPSSAQVELLLWKDVKALRPEGLPGRVLPSEPKMIRSANHWAIGRATSNANGRGTENFQGQHGEYLLFILDEAEGVADFVYDAINAMMTGGRVVLCLMIANPRTRSSRFHRSQSDPRALNYRLSVLDHPNVVEGRDVIPGATKRAWVDQMIDQHCQPVPQEDPDEYTFSVAWRPGVIFLPDPEFMFRVMGIAPKNLADKVMIAPGRYEAACKREPLEEDPTRARIGVDVALFGADYGTIYLRHKGTIRRVARLSHQDYSRYAGEVKDLALQLREEGVTSLHVRVDGGGGYGRGVLSYLEGDSDLASWFTDLELIEVHNNGTPQDPASYADTVTELYAQAAETLKGIRVESPPNQLEEDLTARTFGYVNKAGITVKRLEPKEAFSSSKRIGRSPDDGDGFVLAAAPDFLFASRVQIFV